jgi:hypothetical protein
MALLLKAWSVSVVHPTFCPAFAVESFLKIMQLKSVTLTTEDHLVSI